MTTIIFAHPWHGSFNKSILDEAVNNLKQSNKDYTVIDLNKDEFDPVFRQDELALFSQGKCKDPLVEKYQKLLKQSDSLVFIFPVWWGNIPAILKGFLDKVMLKEFAYTIIDGKVGPKGLLTNIKKATVITTSDSPKWFLKYFAGNTIQGTFIKHNLKSFGIKNVKWLHCGDTKNTKKESLQKRVQFLNKIRTEKLYE